MKVKTSELTGAALNWVVASIEWPNDAAVKAPWDKLQINEMYPFDKDWSLTGPILNTYIDLIEKLDKYTEAVIYDNHPLGVSATRQVGETMQEAILRAYVVGKLGDEVEVPDHLL